MIKLGMFVNVMTQITLLLMVRKIAECSGNLGIQEGDECPLYMGSPRGSYKSWFALPSK